MDLFDLALYRVLNKGGGGGDITVEPLTVTANGQYAAPSGKAYSPVNVNVSPNLEALNVSQNGTYTPGSGKAGFSQVVADVQPNLQSKTATENGTVTPDSGYDGLSSVVVNVSGGGSTLITKTITQNGTYNANADNADGYSQVVVDVQGGGSANIEEWDLTQSLTGKLHGIDMTAEGVAISAQGVVFDSTNDYLRIPISWNGITIEVDVATMNLASGTHHRFIMASDSQGLIYRGTGVWGFYGSGWATDSGETDGSFFDGCTVKVVVDANGYWHIYKDGALWWEPNVAQSMSGSTRQIRIGSYGQSIDNATITGVRLS